MNNSGHRYFERIANCSAQTTLLEYLSRRYAHSTQVEWRERIESGEVLVDNRLVNADSRVSSGQALVWDRPPWREPPAPRGFGLLYQDDDLIGVAKPGGLPTLPGAGYLDHTLLTQVRRCFPKATPMHRLGRWTSGLVLFALTASSRRELSRQWGERTVYKRYRCLLDGSPREGRFVVTDPIGPIPHAALGSIHAASPCGKPAQSEFSLLERRGSRSLFEATIVTGRPHQIRIHAAAAGHPLSGDPLYRAGGRPHPESRALPGDPGYRLHAAELAFDHPRTARRLRLECLPPAILRSTIESAGTDSASGTYRNSRWLKP